MVRKWIIWNCIWFWNWEDAGGCGDGFKRGNMIRRLGVQVFIVRRRGWLNRSGTTYFWRGGMMWQSNWEWIGKPVVSFETSVLYVIIGKCCWWVKNVADSGTERADRQKLSQVQLFGIYFREGRLCATLVQVAVSYRCSPPGWIIAAWPYGKRWNFPYV